MNIKYIKDAPNGKAGSLDTVTDFEANILIKTGFAEIDDSIRPEPPADLAVLIWKVVEPQADPEPEVKPKAKPKSKTKAAKADAVTESDKGTNTESDSE